MNEIKKREREEEEEEEGRGRGRGARIGSLGSGRSITSCSKG